MEKRIYVWNKKFGQHEQIYYYYYFHFYLFELLSLTLSACPF